jgi:hypothetical protein
MRSSVPQKVAGVIAERGNGHGAASGPLSLSPPDVEYCISALGLHETRIDG